MASKTNLPAYGTLRYAEQRIGVARKTLYKLIADGYLSTYRIGRAHRTTDAAINSCLAKLMQEQAEQRVAAA
jgi:predicted DNA-binding transcriptional regulator AlpA